MDDFALAQQVNPNVPGWVVRALPGVPDWLAHLFGFKTYIALFVGAALVTALLTPLYILAAQRLGWVDQPGGRKQHERPTATMGGIVIFATVFAGTFVALQIDNRVGQMLREHSVYIYALLLCTASMVALGMIDDRAAVRPKIKLLVQAVVAIAAVAAGYRIEALTLPVVGSLAIPGVGLVLSVLWIVGITNAINLTDGLDGLAAGVCFLASAANGLVAMWLGNYYMAVMMVLLAGALLGFLRWNFPPARVFLGDTGSMGLGMFLALSSLHASQKAHTVVLILVPLFALGYPIFDTLLAVARRMVRGQPVFSSDRDHIHHRLLDRGASHSAATIQIYVASIILCAACLLAVTANHLAIGLAIAAVLGLALFSVRFLGYLEWGGWISRWRGREETKVLHAAAQLARMRIRSARSAGDLLRAVAVLAPDIQCREITLTAGADQTQWADDENDDGLPAGRRYAVDIAMAGAGTMQFAFDRPDALDAERHQIIEELCRLAAARLAELPPRGASVEPAPARAAGETQK